MVSMEDWWRVKLKATPTQQLLKMRPFCGYLPYDPDEDPPLDLLYAELNTRPHVPNKHESRGLRLQKIREQNRSKKKRLRYSRCG